MNESGYVPDPRESTTYTVLEGGDLGSGGSGSSGAIQVYTGASPPAAPNNPALAALFYPTGGGPIQNWDIPSQTWV